MALLSAVEITLFWVIVWRRRSTAWSFVKNWRHDAFTRFGLVFSLGISLMYGLAFANLGIIARQRAVILPYLMTLVTGHLLGTEPSSKSSPTQARVAIDPLRKAGA